MAGIVAGSNEYFAKRGGHTSSGFLNALFEDALQRPIDADSKAAFTETAAADGARAQAVRAVMGSAEFQADLVDQTYLNVLGRSADSAGRTFWLQQLNHGVSNAQFVNSLMSSNEYVGKAAT